MTLDETVDEVKRRAKLADTLHDRWIRWHLLDALGHRGLSEADLATLDPDDRETVIRLVAASYEFPEPR